MINLKQNALSSLVQCRQFSLAQLSKRNHYDTLGITPNATINEIKKAYYNLSMIYHPDKSNGSSEALEKFRAVTEAYEVLSNLNSKRLYDRGVSYQAPLKKSRPMPKRETIVVPPDLIKQPIYNFDLWSRVHYGESVVRRAAAKKKFYDDISRKEAQTLEDKTIIFIFSLLAILGSAYLLIEIYDSGADVPVQKKCD